MNNSKRKYIVLILALLAAVILGLVVFYYTNMSYLKLNGDKIVTVGLNGVYDEPGAEAKAGGKDVSDDVKITGEADLSTPGDYTINYSSGNFTVSRTVRVLEKMNPELVLKGDEHMTVKLGEKFTEPGYEATDENGNDITDKVEVSYGSLERAGEQSISYDVEDSSGSRTHVERTVTVQQNTEYDTPGLPICMFHYVYDEKDPPDDLYQRFGNYISAQALEEELNWLNEEGYYYPEWKEVREYVDGKLLLPEKSIVLCFDDGSRSFLENGIPVLEKCKVPATCFMITSNNGQEKIDEYQSEYVRYESHTDNMHRPGGSIGHGGIFTAVSRDEGMADLKRSIDICGSGEAFAYPYGDYNDSSRSMVEDSGFLCAMTTQPGKAYPGDDPILLPRVRMSLGQTLSQFQSMVSP